MPARSPHRLKHPQTGATAVEFAFVFPVFFLLFYGLLTYGLIFLMRMGLQHAAEDAVRAALRYPAQTCEQANGLNPNNGDRCNSEQRGQYQFGARLGQAVTTARQQAGWMDGWSVPSVNVSICIFDSTEGKCDEAQEVKCSDEDCEPAGTPPICGSGDANTCRIVVELQYPYGTHPVLPAVWGFNQMIPNTLTGRASLQIDGRALAL